MDDLMLRVHLLPDLVEPMALKDGVVVVTDVLRATTTITTALEHGAKRVIPCLEVDEARRVASEHPQAVLGGERGGCPIPGFHFGNSPAEYRHELINGRTLVFTTTNGTRALMRCRAAAAVFIGSFVNLSAVCEAVRAFDNVHLLCAGTNGQITSEDVLFAGAAVHRLSNMQGDRFAPSRWNDSAQLAFEFWRCRVPNITREQVENSLRLSHGGRNLTSLGMQDDITLASQVDKFSCAPHLNLHAWEIRKS
ncbi:MAG: 2-phosphosulfolactate phosphatase [Pirellulaceae bacterium]